MIQNFAAPSTVPRTCFQERLKGNQNASVQNLGVSFGHAGRNASGTGRPSATVRAGRAHVRSASLLVPAPSVALGSCSSREGAGSLRVPLPRPRGIVVSTSASSSIPASGSRPGPEPGPSPLEEFAASLDRRYIMVSGKGGVGKTSLAASLAAQLAMKGHTTLVVSTDPAHSLSDALEQDVSGGLPVPVPLPDPGSSAQLWAMEIDPREGLQEFREGGGSQETAKQVQGLLSGLGLSMVYEQLRELRLGDLLDIAPPGLDEAVAVAKVVQFTQSPEYAHFSRVVFDTAPTGHTLRLLTMPDFVDQSLDKIIRLRRRLSGATALIRSLFGASAAQDEAIQKLEQLRAKVASVHRLFRDPATTEFVIAAIPTVLSANESTRLLHVLRKEGVPCRRVVVNQLMPDGGGAAGDVTFLEARIREQVHALEMLAADPFMKVLQKVISPYLDIEVRGITGLGYLGSVLWKDGRDDFNPAGLGNLSAAAAAATSHASTWSQTYRSWKGSSADALTPGPTSTPAPHPLSSTGHVSESAGSKIREPTASPSVGAETPSFLSSDSAHSGSGSGRAQGATSKGSNPDSYYSNNSAAAAGTTATSLVDLDPKERFFVMFGGKGGVGKTSCSASLAVKWAMEGRPTLLVSTDPAHSLSDALDQDVGGGLPVQVAGTDKAGNPIPLWALQVDSEKAMTELKQLLAEAGGKKLFEMLDGVGLSMVSDQLRGLGLSELLEAAPPGLDEAVAVAKVVQFTQSPEYAHFARVVFDTAPTGHTLRLLTMPDFVDQTVGKLLRLRRRLQQISGALRSFMSGGRGASDDASTDKLSKLQGYMEEARLLFRDPKQMQFVVVAAPTRLAAAESSRLVRALAAEGVPVTKLVINQIIQASALDTFKKGDPAAAPQLRFATARRADQRKALQLFEAQAHDPESLGSLRLTRAPLLDHDVRGIQGLLDFGFTVWSQPESKAE